MSSLYVKHALAGRVVPAGHCPEPIVEVGYWIHPGRGGSCVQWHRVNTWHDYGDGYMNFESRRSSGGMSWGETESGGARIAQPYGDKIMDSHADLRLPWSVAPLEGKYYGTHIIDADGEEVAPFWDHYPASDPSEREKASFGNWTPEAWAKSCCDSHWESERDYRRAVAIVEAINARAGAQP